MNADAIQNAYRYILNGDYDQLKTIKSFYAASWLAPLQLAILSNSPFHIIKHIAENSAPHQL